MCINIIHFNEILLTSTVHKWQEMKQMMIFASNQPVTAKTHHMLIVRLHSNYDPFKSRPTSTFCRELCKNGWTDDDAVCGMESGGSKEACVRWGYTLAPPDEYDWTVHLRRRCGFFVKLLCPLVFSFRYMLSPVRLSSVCLSVGNVRVPYSAGWNFQQCFYAVFDHPLIPMKKSTEIVPGEPLSREGG